MSTPDALGPQLDVLEHLAGGASVLEPAIGTGRVGLPLSQRGLRVTGIELVGGNGRPFAGKSGGDETSIPVVVGDMTMAQGPGAGSFTLVCLVFNTLMNLTTQQAQVACFENAAAHFAPGARGGRKPRLDHAAMP